MRGHRVAVADGGSRAHGRRGRSDRFPSVGPAAGAANAADPKGAIQANGSAHQPSLGHAGRDPRDQTQSLRKQSGRKCGQSSRWGNGAVATRAAQ